MAAALGGLKAPPLLHPPVVDGLSWARVTSEDAEAIRGFLDGTLRDATENPHRLTDKTFLGWAYARKLGLVADVPDLIVDSMAKKLDSYRQSVHGWGVGSIHYAFKEMGRPQEVTDDDRKAMEAGLESYRKDRLFIWESFHVGEVLTPMKELGVLDRPSADDVRDMEHRLRDYRTDKVTFQGHQLLEALYHMRRLGRPVEATREDMERIQETMGDYRSRRMGDFLLDMHYLIRGVVEVREPPGGPAEPMPPLKRFVP